MLIRKNLKTRGISPLQECYHCMLEVDFDYNFQAWLYASEPILFPTLYALLQPMLGPLFAERDMPQHDMFAANVLTLHRIYTYYTIAIGYGARIDFFLTQMKAGGDVCNLVRRVPGVLKLVTLLVLCGNPVREICLRNRCSSENSSMTR